MSTDPNTEPTSRDRGQAMMRAVYGWDIEPTKAFEVATVDHLFGQVWAERPESLSVRDLRLVLIGMTVGTGQTDVAGLQIDSALKLGELEAEDLRHLTTFLAHYAGWPRAAALNSEIEQIISRHEKAAAREPDQG